jgi:uncharacterized repeat protein (TIGR01451 family)
MKHESEMARSRRAAERRFHHWPTAALRQGALGFAAALLVLCAGNAWGQYAYKVIHTFSGADGAEPQANLVLDSSGNLYGPAAFGGSPGGDYCCGVIFELNPPGSAGGSWTDTTLYDFEAGGSSGAYPQSQLTWDALGNLYGTASGGGSYSAGTVFELSPPAGGLNSWTETTLHSMAYGDVGILSSGLVFDSLGNLYGTALAGGPTGDAGGVYELSPPASGTGSWTSTTLFRFGPWGGPGGGHFAGGYLPLGTLIRDAQGNLYGVTQHGGSDSPFDCPGALVSSLYEYGCGVVFKLSPPSSPGMWTETVLYTFTGGADGGIPEGGLIADAQGNFYGTTQYGGNPTTPECAGSAFGSALTGCGVVFKLSPPSSGSGPWTETVLYAFQGGNDGAFPVASVTMDDRGVLFGTTLWGGGTFAPQCDHYNELYVGCGTVFELSPPAGGTGAWNEAVLYAFTGLSDGAYPEAGVTVDWLGNIFGTAAQGGDLSCYVMETHCGVVFKLVPTTAVLSVVKTHTGNFTQGQSGAQYSMTVSNVGTAPTAAPVLLGDALPAGLTATAISGTDWSCDLPTLICTNSGTVAAGASFPPVTLTVDVSCVAPSAVVNVAGAGGGGAANAPTATDPTTIESNPKCNPGSFSIAVTPVFQMVEGGSVVSYQVTVKSLNGFAGAVTLSCSGLPADAPCAFDDPTVVLPANGTAQTTMLVTTTTADAALVSPADGHGRRGGRRGRDIGLGGSLLSLGLCLAVGSPVRRRKKGGKGSRALLGLVLLWLLLGLAGCGGPPPPGERTYTITVTGTAGTAGSASATTTLVVN